MNIPGEEPRWRDAEYFASGNSSPAGNRFCENNADDGFIKTYSLQLVAGRTFNTIPGQDSNKVLINELAAKTLGFNQVQDAVGKYLYMLLFYLVQKSKEVAIRKISGAYVLQLVLFINKGFVKWNLIAFLMACPLVYLISYRWLQNFAYKTTISWVGISVGRVRYFYNNSFNH